MILIGIGANLPSPRFGDPVATCEAAVAALGVAGVVPLRVSRWYRSAPVPVSDQPWFVNGLALVESDLPPEELLAILHGIERDFGRVRQVRNEARVIDLDLLAHGARISRPGEVPVLPHPRLAERAFVLLPLVEIAPDWRHPASGEDARTLAARLPADQVAEPIGPAAN